MKKPLSFEQQDEAKKHANLLDFMAKACHYAQSHVGDGDAWSTDQLDRETLLQCTSFQMACFLAQNTVKGEEGVEWEIVLEKLTDTRTDRNGLMTRSVAQWKKILGKLVKELGGWK